MHIGLSMFATDRSMRIDELAREAESRGFESLWVPEHTHIPTSRRSPYPGGGELPDEYRRTLDPFVALAAAAAVTSRLKVGAGVCLLIERDTLVTAKEVASLDWLSSGRFLFGVGAGWNAEEMENHGTVFATRFKKLREQVSALKRIWTEDEPEFHGRFVDFDPIWSWPKPVHKPHPPIYFGGGPTRHTFDRVVDLGDGWLPLARAGEAVFEGIAALRARAEQRGRDPASVRVSVFGAAADAKLLERFEQAGVERVTLGLPSAGRDRVLPLLDEWSGLVTRGS